MKTDKKVPPKGTPVKPQPAGMLGKMFMKQGRGGNAKARKS